tara:strand:+ start:50928 stop:51278 length:351 start_codon:yes stop_codon:yes gene_type:complete
MSNELYDLSILSEMVYDDKDFMKELVGTFIEFAPIDAAELKEFADSQNWDETAKKAHKLKSSIRTIGVTSLTDLILEIEEDAKNERNLESILLKIATFLDILVRVLESLKKEPFLQ